MSSNLKLTKQPIVSKSAYLATTGYFLGIAIITAAARAFIRTYHLRRINADDYLFFFAVLTLITGAGLFFTFMPATYLLDAIADRTEAPPPDWTQKAEKAALYAVLGELFSWLTIYAIKFSFLFYFRALVNRLYEMEIWWWVTLVVLIPVAGVSIFGAFIACPHVGLSLLTNCGSRTGFLRREHGLLYQYVVCDIVTDIMLIAIPVIILRKSSFKMSQKLNIALVLCLSIFMVAIALVRGISAGVRGTDDETWNSFWVQLEASISVIAACPTAFRSLFLFNHAAKRTPESDIPGKRSALERLWKRTKPSLERTKVGATLTGMRTMIQENGQTRLGSQSEDGYALSADLGQSGQSHLENDESKQIIERKPEPYNSVV